MRMRAAVDMRAHLTWFALLLLLGASATTATQEEQLDYPQWRGRHRDGGASGFFEPPVWPAELTRQWTVRVGEGYATPLVVGGRVFMFTRRNDDEMVTSLDAETGSVLWQTTYAAPYDMFAATAVHGPDPRPLLSSSTASSSPSASAASSQLSMQRTADFGGRFRDLPSSPSTVPPRRRPPTATSSSCTPATTTH